MKIVGFQILFLTLIVSCFAEVSLTHMPIVEMEPKAQSDLSCMAVEWTGDAGFRKSDRSICRSLKNRNIPTVSVNSFRYFLRKRSPEEAGESCGRLIQYFEYKWKRREVILIGYSFGADAIPFIYNKLPEEIKKTISLLVIINPAYKADFHFHVSSWFGHTTKNALPVIPELKKITGANILCVYGKHDRISSGAAIEKEKIGTVVMLNTGHHISKYSALIADEVLKMLRPGEYVN